MIENETEPTPGEQADEIEASGPDGGVVSAERATSSIVFPYNPLKDAEAVAREIHGKWGTETNPENLARGMDASPRSGAFRNKLSAARIFGVVEVSRGRVTLTPLGVRVIDPLQQREARVEAFLNVPLFRRLYEAHSGALLPQNAALEHEIRQLGVLPKQVERARWAFQKSAEFAGFFEKGANRLIAPAGAASGGSQGSPSVPDPEQPLREADPLGQGTQSQRRQPTELPEVLEAPVLTMLDAGESWDPQKTHDYVDGLRKMHRALKGS